MNFATSQVSMSLSNVVVAVFLWVIVNTSLAQNTPKGKGADNWSAEEYSGVRDKKEIQTAMTSKGFTWITGSPADNEKLSIGKNAQFFGFVALRYQSGRAANRGALGRAMHSIASDQQRDDLARAVQNISAPLAEWWSVREEILTQLEDHLYTGMPIDEKKLMTLGERFALLNSEVAIFEARAYAAFEDNLSAEQVKLITNWRQAPELTRDYSKNKGLQDERVGSEDWASLENLYAKCFSWISGRSQDNEIIPKGQPAQFFGFVSIRHKSGRGASRGKIAKDFYAMLNAQQRALVKQAVDRQEPVVARFLDIRRQYLNQLAKLRTSPSDFDLEKSELHAREMGRLEMMIASLEAQAYRNIRASMTEEQIRSAMAMRSNYVVDDSTIEKMNIAERGAALSVLCSGCHSTPGQWRDGMIGPNLDGLWQRAIASEPRFRFSNAMQTFAETTGPNWTPELMDQFLANPQSLVPGTKMEFQGLLSPEDRQAVIENLMTNR